MVIELPEKAVPWTKPDDVSLSQLRTAESIPTGRNGGYINVLFANGSVYAVAPDAFNDGMRNALTRSEGAPVDRELLKIAEDHDAGAQ
jgi:hypothetical protein